MKFSKYTTCALVALLIVLNVIFRYPTTPHEIGWDSFAMHLLANSISEFGYAKWWIHPASIGGFYPYSYASAVPFLLSGISQCTGIGMEWIIWLFSILIGIFSASTAYLMAGAIKDDDVFKYLVALIYSTSTGILYFTTWTVSARGLFIVLMPLFIYLLLKCRISLAKYNILTLILFVVLLFTHHLFYYIILVVVSYLIVIIFYKLKMHARFANIPKNVVNFALLVCFLGMFAILFFIIGAELRNVWLEIQFIEYARIIGFSVIFIIGGFSYLLLKPVKSFEEWFLLIVLLGLTPMLHILYTKWFFLAFACLLIGVALTNIFKTTIKKRKGVTSTIVVILLLSSISFAGYYQFVHFWNDPDPYTRYMEDETYIGALWMKDVIDKDKNMIAESYISHRVFSTSEVPTLTGIGAADLAYDFVYPNELEITQIHSPLSATFYLQNPYKLVNQSSTAWSARAITSSNINDHSSWAYRLTPKFNLSYYVENKDIQTTFTWSVQLTKNNLYDNGKIRVWRL